MQYMCNLSCRWVLASQDRLDQLLIHTNQGSQYRATDYRELLDKHKISCSMSAIACSRVELNPHQSFALHDSFPQ